MVTAVALVSVVTQERAVGPPLQGSGGAGWGAPGGFNAVAGVWPLSRNDNGAGPPEHLRAGPQFARKFGRRRENDGGAGPPTTVGQYRTLRRPIPIPRTFALVRKVAPSATS